MNYTNHHLIFALLIYLSEALCLANNSQQDKEKVIQVTEALLTQNEELEQELYIIFQNNTEQILQAPFSSIQVDKKTLTSAVYAKNDNALRHRYPIHPRKKGAFVVDQTSEKWEHCKKIEVIVQTNQLFKFKRMMKKEQDQKLKFELRIRDLSYSSTCKHLE